MALPVLNAGIATTTDFYIMCVQRFILVVVLLFVFEIIDLAWDDPHLRTVPQQIGVAKTKWLGLLLMCILLLLEIPKEHKSDPIMWVNIAFGIVVCVFLFFANDRRGKYYTTFFVEIVTVFWWLALVAFV
ncbi:MAG: hypothetical protein EOP06_27290 [Proteobacteria bacterium]|nr:MAG: hypothetical protein EOP06_27290 [Pseudomonadota bacterium]